MSAIIVDIEKPKISELIKTLDSAPKLDALPHDIIGNTVYRLSLSETTKGDKHNAAQRSHGNTKTLETSHTYRRTLPSTLAKIKEAVKTTPAPAVYKSSIAAAENNQPRNLNQVKYERHKHGPSKWFHKSSHTK
ncbi:unnamed protein product [Didymodactylos carnosus]|uniref:Uncharacterized protein n=1 Tax=Didymodactylos carnosus TaxID=1234261 RepID=A0A8S2U4T3_9BILA|nr:unnamed protein product [Didymodactylos carnosus]CAF4325614.1 unnamed protein product [Didymodactylos carnosus]